MNRPDVTRRRVLIGTGAALSTALAGCGNPEGQEEDGDSPDGGGGAPEEDTRTPDSENDPYAPDDNSTRGSGNETVATRGPGGEDDEGGDGGNGSDDAHDTDDERGEDGGQ